MSRRRFFETVVGAVTGLFVVHKAAASAQGKQSRPTRVDSCSYTYTHNSNFGRTTFVYDANGLRLEAPQCSVTTFVYDSTSLRPLRINS